MSPDSSDEKEPRRSPRLAEKQSRELSPVEQRSPSKRPQHSEEQSPSKRQRSIETESTSTAQPRKSAYVPPHKRPGNEGEASGAPRPRLEVMPQRTPSPRQGEGSTSRRQSMDLRQGLLLRQARDSNEQVPRNFNGNEPVPESRRGSNASRSDAPSTPTRSELSQHWFSKTNVAAEFRDQNYEGPIEYIHCRTSNLKMDDILQGEIVRVPYHVPNTDPETDVNDNALRATCAGPVYSKLRMFIVLWKHREHLFALPLYSWNNRGLKSRREHMRPEYVCVKEVDDDGFVNRSTHFDEPLKVRKYPKAQKHRLKRTCCCHLAGGHTIFYKADMIISGRLTKKSYDDLLRHYDQIVADARSTTWVLTRTFRRISRIHHNGLVEAG